MSVRIVVISKAVFVLPQKLLSVFGRISESVSVQITMKGLFDSSFRFREGQVWFVIPKPARGDARGASPTTRGVRLIPRLSLDRGKAPGRARLATKGPEIYLTSGIGDKTSILVITGTDII